MCFKFGFNLIIVLKLTFKLSKQQQLVAKSLIVLLCVHDPAINENVTLSALYKYILLIYHLWFHSISNKCSKFQVLPGKNYDTAADAVTPQKSEPKIRFDATCWWQMLRICHSTRQLYKSLMWPYRSAPLFYSAACCYRWRGNKFENNVWISRFLISAPHSEKNKTKTRWVCQRGAQMKWMWMKIFLGALKSVCALGNGNARSRSQLRIIDSVALGITNFKLRITDCTIYNPRPRL